LDKNGFKRSESGFDTNKVNLFLSISIHFRLREWFLPFNHIKKSYPVAKLFFLLNAANDVSRHRTRARHTIYRNENNSYSYRYENSLFNWSS